MRTKQSRPNSPRRSRGRSTSSSPSSPLVAHILNLQRLAGNQAVTMMLQRDKEKDAPKAAATVTFKALGAVGVDSFSFAKGGTRTRKTDEKKPGEMAFTSHVGDHSAGLFKASVSGLPDAPANVVLAAPGLHVTLIDVIVSNYATSGAGDAAYEQWSLNFEDMTVAQ